MDERRVAPSATGGSGTHPPGRKPDRRLARGDDTRATIVDATIALIRSGNPRPTVAEVARRAGVSVRLVHHHFHGVESLVLQAAELHSERYRSLITRLPPHGPVSIRVRAICHQRRLLFEALAPVLLAVILRAGGSSDKNDVVSEYRVLLRTQLAATLQPEMLAHGGEARILLDAIEVATGWQSWLSLRLEGGRSPAEAERVMYYAVSLLLR